MTSHIDPEPVVADASAGRRRGTLGWVIRQPAALFGGSVLLLLCLVAAFAPALAPASPEAQDLQNAFSGPTSSHWLGTDDLGRDLLSRLVFAARLSIAAGLATVALALLVAVPIGLVAGYVGGRVDFVLMRLVDASMSLPPLVLALSIVGAMGPGLGKIVFALAFVFAPQIARLVRGEAMAIREETFIEASKSIGTSDRWIVQHRVLPNLVSPLMIAMAFAMASALLAEAALSYLGLGAQAPDASLGSMLRRAYDKALFTHSWQLVLPGLVIALTVLAATSLAEGVRGALGAEGARPKMTRADRRGFTTVDPELHRQVLTGHDDISDEDRSLEVRGLGVEFGTKESRHQVTHGVSIEVRRGEVVGLVGESGSGKSVTSLAALRLLASPPARIVSGEVWWGGRDLLALDDRQMRRVRGGEIGVVFQDPMTSLDPNFTVGSQLVEVVRLHSGCDRKQAEMRAVELLDQVGIPDPSRRLKDFPHHMSGGMRQRVMIAIALAGDPDVLIADEPTTALDVTIQAQILELLAELQSELGLAILLVTHDLGVVAQQCQRVAVMYAGQIVEEADVFELFAEPKHPYTEGLLRAMPQIGKRDERLAVIPGTVPDPDHRPSGCVFSDRCAYATDECRSNDPELVDLGAGRRTRCLRHAELNLRGTSTHGLPVTSAGLS